MGAWKGSGVLMDRLKAGSGAGDREMLGSGLCAPVLPSQGWGPGAEAALSAAEFDGFPAVCLTVCSAPRAGCPRERRWEAVELASAAGQPALPLALC